MDLVLKQFPMMWDMITRAPVPFISILVVISLVAYQAAKWRYGAQLEQRDERIKHKDELIADYKAKLSGATPDEARAQIQALELEVTALRVEADATRNVKARTRQLLDKIDPRIVQRIDAGTSGVLAIRMEPAQFKALKDLADEAHGEFLKTVSTTLPIRGLINNETLGPTYACIQLTAQVEIFPALQA